MTDLLDRLCATEGSRELDIAIEVDVHGPDGAADELVPRYTTSTDAAMTLVPEGWRVYQAGQSADNKWYFDLIARTENSSTGACWAPTPALALCIAATTARDATETRAAQSTA